jgi:hypothetical protein
METYSNLTARVIRPGDSSQDDPGWITATPEERMSAVWDLTLLCLAWQGDHTWEPRLRDLLAEFNVLGVEYLIVGAHALAAHGHVRATRDLDVWVRPHVENAKKVLKALKEFGTALHDLTEADLTRQGTVFQIGLPPLRIDIITAIDAVSFDEAWSARLLTKFADLPTAVLSREHLIRNKRATGRTQDLADLEWLETNK